MQITYIKSGKIYKTSESNHDLAISTIDDEGRYTIKVKAKNSLTLVSVTKSIPFHVNFKDRYFLNGYQSWTDSHEYKLNKRLRNIKKAPHIISRLFAMKAYGDSIFYNYSIRKSHGYDFFYSKGKYESFIINLIPNDAYLTIELVKDNRNLHLISDVNGIKLEKGETSVVLDYFFVNDYKEGLEKFNELYPKKNIEKLFGYTSWYNYYQNINEEIILRDLDALDSRFQLFQIDDGYETYVGDWLDVDPKKFPNGLEPIVKKIHEKGLKAGLWLAPFVAETESKLFKTRPELFKKDKHGKPLRTGVGWSGQYSLDIEKEEAVKYIKTCLKHYLDMGFDFFKLDFLYAINNGKNSYSRASISEKGYQLLRDILGDKLILGCGAIPSSSIHHFDYIRVGMDLTLDYEGGFYDKIKPCYEYPSTRNTLQNTIYRSFMGQRLFGNDPDVFLLRDDNTSLSLEQRRSVTTINALFGDLLMCSDNIATYNEEQKKILENCLDIFRNATNKKYVLDNDIIHIQYELKGQKHYFDFNVKEGLLFTKE